VNLLSEEPSPVSVKALEETRLILISREQFAPLLKDYPEVSAAVGQGVSQWLHRASANIESLTARRPRVPSLTWFDFAPLILLSLLCALAFNFSNPRGIPLIPQSISNETLTWISPSAAFEKYKRGRALFIDALPSAFHEEEHISNDLSLPLAIFDFIYDMKLGKMDKETEIIVYGRTISKHYDQEVAAKLTARGFRNVKILKGGLKAWKKNNYPVVS
jgi:rhodanese-related sulfurtransferase